MSSRVCDPLLHLVHINVSDARYALNIPDDSFPSAIWSHAQEKAEAESSLWVRLPWVNCAGSIAPPVVEEIAVSDKPWEQLGCGWRV